MCNLTFLGVWMTPDVGETVSFVLDVEDNGKVLVDCGTNLVGSLIRNNIDPVNITHIIVTHSHGDHISGLPTYLFYRLLIAPGIFGKEVKPLKIVGTKNTLDNVKEYIKSSYGTLVDNPMLNFTEINASGNYFVNSIKFSFFSTKHVPETVGFYVNISNKLLVYSSDTGISERIIKYAENADVLIHDVVGTSKYSMLSESHTLCNEISPLLSKYHVKHFYPVHRLSIYKKNYVEYLCELKSNYNGFISVPEDGDVIYFN